MVTERGRGDEPDWQDRSDSRHKGRFAASFLTGTTTDTGTISISFARLLPSPLRPRRGRNQAPPSPVATYRKPDKTDVASIRRHSAFVKSLVPFADGTKTNR